MANGYIANSNDTWGSISRTLGVTERALTQRNRGISNISGGVVVQPPQIPPVLNFRRQAEAVRNLYNRANAPTGPSLWNPIQAMRWLGGDPMGLYTSGGTGLSERIRNWRQNPDPYGIYPDYDPQAMARAENVWGALAPFREGQQEIDEAIQTLKNAGLAAATPVGSGRSGEGYGYQGRNQTWQEKYVDPYRSEGSKATPKWLAEQNARRGETADATIMSQGMEEARFRYAEIDKAIKSNQDPPRLTFSDIAKIAASKGVSIETVIGQMESEEGGYTKVGSTWILQEGAEKQQKTSGGVEPWTWHGYDRDVERIEDMGGYPGQTKFEVERQSSMPGQTYTATKRYDAFGQLKSYAPSVKSRGRKRGNQRPTKGQRNRYKSQVYTKDQSRFFKWREKQREDGEEEVATGGSSAGYAAQPYGSYANYQAPRSSQVYRNMYDPLGNINWKID